MDVVVDASVIIDYLRRGSHKNSHYVALIESGARLLVSLATVAELYSGSSAFTKRGKAFLRNFLSGVHVNIPNMEQAILAGRLRFRCQLSLGDAFVAAVAKEGNLPIATLDQKAFRRVRGLKLYTRERSVLEADV